jgi:hypothetical protein
MEWFLERRRGRRGGRNMAGRPGMWISKAIKHPGEFTAKAKRAGMGVQEYAEEVTGPGSKASTETKRQANLARTLKKLGKRKKKKS